jgi:hypothetical protein
MYSHLLSALKKLFDKFHSNTSASPFNSICQKFRHSHSHTHTRTSPKMPPKQVKGEYIETDTGNKVSRKSNILGSQNIILGGKTIIQGDCTIRGDLRRIAGPGQHANVAIAVGRYCFFARSSMLRPPGKMHRGSLFTFKL